MGALLLAGDEGAHLGDEGFEGSNDDTGAVPLEGDFVLTVRRFLDGHEVALAEFGSVEVNGAVVRGDGLLAVVVNTGVGVFVHRSQGGLEPVDAIFLRNASDRERVQGGVRSRRMEKVLQSRSRGDTGHEFQRASRDAIEAGTYAVEWRPVENGGNRIEYSRPFCGFKSNFVNQGTHSDADGSCERLYGSFRPGGGGDGQTVADVVSHGERRENLVAEMRPLV